MILLKLLLVYVVVLLAACDSPPDYLVAPPAAKPATLEELEELYELFDALPQWVIATREECIELNGQWTPDGCYIGGPGRSVEVEVVEEEVVEVEVVEVIEVVEVVEVIEVEVVEVEVVEVEVVEVEVVEVEVVEVEVVEEEVVEEDKVEIADPLPVPEQTAKEPSRADQTSTEPPIDPPMPKRNPKPPSTDQYCLAILDSRTDPWTLDVVGLDAELDGRDCHLDEVGCYTHTVSIPVGHSCGDYHYIIEFGELVRGALK